ncbi:TonB-dependent receptor domain-containing protein [Thalassomonas actiniarum]|uniref:TonB-dependent receptor n=1 Tax=Thalassomonas actiniarum TaxID=485447 RepID=A0AAE9YLV5_9GAMM|nr:TonB-dependent receptor [Thalassomonas actiniarum]WDD97590.1 TonB-dependent receptor [Thalassomonas actiniarum]
MFSNSKVAKSIRLAMAFGAVSATAISANAVAAEQEEEVERISVTGSSIKRTDMEGALPITTLSSEDIVRSGVTSVPDLMAQLPSMQGFTTAADSVGGGGGGIQSASLRALGDEYTLVLLNGRRMASSDSGGVIDLNQIPLAAIERVEVLMDGASALYGSDAIAGVVNFIMKDDLQETNVSVRYDRPQEKGGSSYNFSISTGYGDLSTDGFNVMMAYSHDSKEQLKSKDRDFANTGILDFSHNGEDYTLVQGSANAGPGNAYAHYQQFDADGNLVYQKEYDENGDWTGGYTDQLDLATVSFNPYREQNGECGPNSAPSGTTCVFDYTSTLEIAPEYERDNLFLQGKLEISDDLQAYANYSWSKFDMITRIAPYPSLEFGLDMDGSLAQNEVIPHIPELDNANLADGRTYGELDNLTARWRTLPGGNRTDSIETTTHHAVMGLKGDINDIAFDVSLTFSEADRKTDRLTGYPLDTEFRELLAAGTVNVFGTFEDLTDEQNQAVKDTMYSGPWDRTETSSISLEGQASTAVMELPAGDMYVGVGGDYREVEYKATNADANTNEIIFLDGASDEYDLSRETYGMFVEAVIPVFDNFEVTAAVRYDNVGKITNDMAEEGTSKTVNKDVDDTTYKISAAYRPNDDWLVRASIGTGFKAATMKQIASPREDFGVTSDTYLCPQGLAGNLAALCKPEPTQYEVWREGNADLKPETSEQMSAGFVYAPSNEFSFALDYWNVELKDKVERLTQPQIFNDPVTYAHLFTTKTNGEGTEDLAIIQAASNIGVSKNSGIDWALELTNELSFGTLKTSFAGTYVIESKSLRVGTGGSTGEEAIWDSSLGRFGIDEEVVFRTVARLSNTLTHGDFAHTLNLNYRSGYEDALATGGAVRMGDDINTVAPDIQLYVSSYMKADWVTKYYYNDNLDFSVGINNVFDKQPPLSLRTGGAGHQVGYDPRYVDVYGRTFYMSANYTF